MRSARSLRRLQPHSHAHAHAHSLSLLLLARSFAAATAANGTTNQTHPPRRTATSHRPTSAAATFAQAMSGLSDHQLAQQTAVQLHHKLKALTLQHQQAAQRATSGDEAAPAAAAAHSATPTKLRAVMHPLRRRWLPLTAGDAGVATGASSPPSGASITVLSYNLLAQSLVRRDVFPYSSRSSLKVAFRRDNLLAELLAADADILCLQEVDADLMAGFWREKLGQAGYKGEWAGQSSSSRPRRSGWAHNSRSTHAAAIDLTARSALRCALCLPARRESAKHGCAIFYRKHKSVRQADAMTASAATTVTTVGDSADAALPFLLFVSGSSCLRPL